MLGQKFMAALTMDIVRELLAAKNGQGPKIGPSSGSGLVPPQTAPWVFRASLLTHSPPNTITDHHGKLTWTEPARYWHKAFLLACLDHTVP